VILPVGGMRGAACARKVEAALKRLPGVTRADADLPSRTVSVEFRPLPGRLEVKHLRRAVERAGYDALEPRDTRAQAETAALLSRQDEQRRLMTRLQGILVLWVPLLLAGPMSLSPYTALLIAVPLQFWGGGRFHAGLARALRRRRADLDALVSVSAWGFFAAGAYATMFPETLPPAGRAAPWGPLGGLLALATLGRWLESRTRGKAGEAVVSLTRRTPKTARVARAGAESVVPVGEVAAGETVVVRRGEQVPVDGEVLSGRSTVDDSLLTGDAGAVEKSPGTRVWAGTLNKGGALEVRASAPGAESALARLVEAVRVSQSTKPVPPSAADRLAAWLTPAALVLAAAAAFLWLREPARPHPALALACAAAAAAAVCPAAAALAGPLAVSAAMRRAAARGVLIRNAEILDEVARLDAVIFDKTGTLTRGTPRVVGTIVLSGTEEELFTWAAACERRSEHPFAAAAAARAGDAALPPADSYEHLPGRGVTLRSGGRVARAGSLAWLKEEGVAIPQDDATRFSEAGSLLGVALDGELLGALRLEDELRSSAAAAVAALKAEGLEVCLVSGDRNEAAYRVADVLGVRTVFAELRPGEKADIVRRFQAEGRRVAVVAEGFHDAPALSRADVGIALSRGTDVAVEAADLALTTPDLTRLAETVALSRRLRRTIRRNLGLAVACQAAVLPLAAGALYPGRGLLLTPAVAGAASALGVAAVVLNSLSLRRDDA
jgi:Cu+-exporting ATPase